MSPPFDLAAYLSRVGLASPPKAEETGLVELHRAQAFAIPFENFDVLWQRGVSLQPADLMAKLVHRRRGGYCFELNGLLQLALGALGFEARPLMARVLLRRPPGAPPGPRTHQLALVELGGRAWVADAGFGAGSLRLPVPLGADVEHEQHGETFRLRRDDELGWVMQLLGVDGWQDLYAFTLERVYPGDLIVANHFTATHPASPFTRFAMLARPLDDGRLTLVGDRVTRYGSGSPRSEPAPRGEALRRLLEEDFGIALDAVPEELPPAS